MARLTQTQQRALKKLRETVQLHSACITFTPERMIEIRKSEGYLADHTPIIREAVDLYVKTWVLPTIDALINDDTEFLKIVR